MSLHVTHVRFKTVGVKLEAGFGMRKDLVQGLTGSFFVSLAVTKLHRLKVKLCTFIRVAVPIF